MTMFFPIILVMVSSVIARDCPEQCTCSKITRYALDREKDTFLVHARCQSHINLTEFSENIQRITIQDSSVDLDVFLDDLDENFLLLPSLTTLNFINCSLNCANITFNTEQITFLTLKNSCISSVPAFNIRDLETLDLSNNKLKVFKYTPYRTLANLQVLNLSANGANSVKDKYFTGLIGLKCLDLSNNNLSVLNDKVLLPVSNLQYLNLSNNRLEVLNEACFSSLLRLQQLDVSWNRLARVVPGNLELPSLARLLIAGNPNLGNSRKPTLLVGTGRRLQTVDASRTGLKQVPAALTHSIRTLRLAGNSISAVNCGDLDSYPLLQILDFTSNDLKQIEDDALGRLDSLTVLYLTDNKLASITRSLPERMKVLHLERNRIKTIQTNDLQNLNQLEVLLLSDNKITSVEENALNHLHSLVLLDLSRNPINVLPPGMLTISGKLEILRLSGIPALPSLEEVAFPLTSTEYLIILDLSRSPGLAHQFLADTAALVAAREMQELNLADTDLEYIRSDLLHYLPQLRLFHLEGNPLNCTNLYWLGVWMRKQDEEEYGRVTCASPAEYWSLPVVDLQEIEQNDRSLTTEKMFEIPRRYSSDLVQNYSEKFNTKLDYNITYYTDDKVSESYTFKLFTETSNGDNKDTITDTTTSESSILPNLTRKNADNKSREYEIGSENENTTTAAGKLSMYCGDNNYNKVLAHPGMIILVFGVLITAAVLVLITSQITRKRNLRQQSEMEVSSIPSVTELW